MTFCYWEVFNDSNFYIALAICISAFLLLLLITNECRKIYRFRSKIDANLHHIYIYLFLWGIFYTIKHLFGLISYANLLRNNYTEEDMEIYSQAFCVLDSVPTFFIQGLLILIPYLWLKNICKFLGKLNRKSNKTKKLIWCLSFYNVLRCFIYLGLYAAEMLVDLQTAATMCQILIGYIIFQSLINLSLFIFGIRYLYSKFQVLNLNDQKKRKQFRNQYAFMIFCSMTRLIMDFVFIVFSDTDSSNCINHRYNDYLYSILYLLLGSILMHFAPVILILYLYRIDYDYLVKNSSLIDKDSN